MAMTVTMVGIDRPQRPRTCPSHERVNGREGNTHIAIIWKALSIVSVTRRICRARLVVAIIADHMDWAGRRV